MDPGLGQSFFDLLVTQRSKRRRDQPRSKPDAAYGHRVSQAPEVREEFQREYELDSLLRDLGTRREMMDFIDYISRLRRGRYAPVQLGGPSRRFNSD